MHSICFWKRQSSSSQMTMTPNLPAFAQSMNGVMILILDMLNITKDQFTSLLCHSVVKQVSEIPLDMCIQSLSEEKGIHMML